MRPEINRSFLDVATPGRALHEAKGFQERARSARHDERPLRFDGAPCAVLVVTIAWPRPAEHMASSLGPERWQGRGHRTRDEHDYVRPEFLNAPVPSEALPALGELAEGWVAALAEHGDRVSIVGTRLAVGLGAFCGDTPIGNVLLELTQADD
ncbi:MAG: hypothetical protein PGN13_16440 [Patulibacter minatonensis]